MRTRYPCGILGKEFRDLQLWISRWTWSRGSLVGGYDSKGSTDAKRWLVRPLMARPDSTTAGAAVKGSFA